MPKPTLTAADRKAIGARLKEARLEAGLSQQELAEAVGVRRESVTLIETGRNLPTTALALELAVQLDLSLDWLIGGATE